MGIFKKLIDILSDEVEEEETISVKEPAKKEIKEEKKETKKESINETKFVNTGIYDASKDKDLFEETKTVPERGLYQSKDTFKFPVFDDKDLEKTLSRSRTSSNVMEYDKPRERTTTIETPKKEEVVVEKKAFRPSPVISPVYGVLDKNYTKDEIVERKDEESKSIPKSELNYDTVRRKAYGTLEDELEDTLMSINKSTMKQVNEIQKDIEELENPKKHIEKLLDELEKTASMTVGEIEEALKDEIEETEEGQDPTDEIISEFDEEKPKNNVEDSLLYTSEFKPQTEKVKVDDKELENDLFNLIDSMYEEGDEN